MNSSWIHQSLKNGHSRSSRNVLNTPLDSSAACSRRRSTTYIPVGVPINDEEAGIKAVRLTGCVYRFVVIPAKAGIQGGETGPDARRPVLCRNNALVSDLPHYILGVASMCHTKTLIPSEFPQVMPLSTVCYQVNSIIII